MIKAYSVHGATDKRRSSIICGPNSNDIYYSLLFTITIGYHNCDCSIFLYCYGHQSHQIHLAEDQLAYLVRALQHDQGQALASRQLLQVCQEDR